MNAYEKLMRLDYYEFKLITGVTKEVFDKMLEVLKQKYKEDHEQGGQPGLAVELRLALALEYWREYRSIRHMANDHQIPRTVINRAILWVEDTLSESSEFKLKSLQKRFLCEEEDEEIEIILVDVEEQPIERPKTNQKESYSGKKSAIQRNIRL